MRKYDATKYLRQMFHRPNTVPFANVLIIILITMFIVSGVSDFGHIYIDIPDAVYGEYEPANVFPEIFIKRSGLVLLDGRCIEDLEKLPMIIEIEMEKHRLAEKKVLFKIDKDVPFGKVQEVLTLVKKANVETIGLITLENATLEHLWATPAK